MMDAERFTKMVLEREFQAAAAAYDTAVDILRAAERKADNASRRWMSHWNNKAADAQVGVDRAWQRLHAAQIATGRIAYVGYDEEEDEPLTATQVRVRAASAEFFKEMQS